MFRYVLHLSLSETPATLCNGVHLWKVRRVVVSGAPRLSLLRVCVHHADVACVPSCATSKAWPARSSRVVRRACVAFVRYVARTLQCYTPDAPVTLQCNSVSC